MKTNLKIKKSKIFKKSVGKSSFHYLKTIVDSRGDLSVGEFLRDIPFIPKRYFVITKVPSSRLRGEHAHIKCHQFLICVKGKMTVTVDNGYKKEKFLLNSCNKGFYLPPMHWSIQSNMSKDAILLVFASHFYNEKDYIREYKKFLKKLKK